MTETERTQHTSGHWYWRLDEEGRPFNLRAQDGHSDVHILFAGNDFNGDYAFRSAEANAQFIVTCCNAHDKLVETIREMLRLFDRGLPDKSIGRETCDIAREVLAELGESK